MQNRDDTFSISRNGRVERMRFTQVRAMTLWNEASGLDALVIKFWSQGGKDVLTVVIGQFSRIEGPAELDVTANGRHQLFFHPEVALDSSESFGAVKGKIKLKELNRAERWISADFFSDRMFTTTGPLIDSRPPRDPVEISGSFEKLNFTGSSK